MNAKLLTRICAAALVALTPAAAWAQLLIQDSFTGASTTYNWQVFTGACLTAGNNTGTIPACVGLPYYTEPLVGGTTGTLPDAAGSGALRFTNDATTTLRMVRSSPTSPFPPRRGCTSPSPRRPTAATPAALARMAPTV